MQHLPNGPNQKDDLVADVESKGHVVKHAYIKIRVGNSQSYSTNSNNHNAQRI